MSVWGEGKSRVGMFVLQWGRSSKERKFDDVRETRENCLGNITGWRRKGEFLCTGGEVGLCKVYLFIMLELKARHMDTDAGGWVSSGSPISFIQWKEETRPKLKVILREEVAEC